MEENVLYSTCSFLKDKYSFVNRYHFAIFSILITLYIGTRYVGESSLSKAIFCIMSILICISKTNQLTYLFFMVTPMFLYITLGTLPIYNVILAVLFIKRFLFENIKINKSILITVICLILTELVGMLLSGISFSLNQVKFFMIIFITVLQLYHPIKDYNNTVAAKYMICGTFLYAIFYLLVNYNVVINPSIRSGGLGDLDPNTYGLYNLFAMSIILLFIFNSVFSKKELLFSIVALITIFFAGIMTLSKTYILVLGIMIILFLLGKKGKIKTSLFFLIAFIGIYFLFENNLFLKDTYNNLIARFTEVSNLQEFTTGRSELMTGYLEYLWENIQKFIFGQGMYSYLPLSGISIRPHNCTIEIIYSWGIVGTFLILNMYIKGSKRYNIRNKIWSKRFTNLIPLVVLVIFMQSLTLLYQEATYAYIIMAIMLISTPKKHKKFN